MDKVNILKQKRLGTCTQNDVHTSATHPKKRKITEIKHVSRRKNKKSKGLTPVFIPSKLNVGQWVAVAYNLSWFPGTVHKLNSDTLALVNFMSPIGSKFKWPVKPDIKEVESIFVFYTDFNIEPADNSCRLWTIPQLGKINAAYTDYKKKYM